QAHQKALSKFQTKSAPTSVSPANPPRYTPCLPHRSLRHPPKPEQHQLFFYLRRKRRTPHSLIPQSRTKKSNMDTATTVFIIFGVLVGILLCFALARCCSSPSATSTRKMYDDNNTVIMIGSSSTGHHHSDGGGGWSWGGGGHSHGGHDGGGHSHGGHDGGGHSHGGHDGGCGGGGDSGGGGGGDSGGGGGGDSGGGGGGGCD
ncbi:MAG: hypothetical protein BYD32DRAFT_17663, partial [Podila humilis]